MDLWIVMPEVIVTCSSGTASIDVALFNDRYINTLTSGCYRGHASTEAATYN
jgi:hypothetical protein